jgi:hypothetical protein
MKKEEKGKKAQGRGEKHTASHEVRKKLELLNLVCRQSHGPQHLAT